MTEFLWTPLKVPTGANTNQCFHSSWWESSIVAIVCFHKAQLSIQSGLPNELHLNTEFVVDSILSLLSHYEIGNGIAYYLRFGTWLTFTLREFCSMSHLYSFDAFAWNISTAFGKKRNKWLTHVWEKNLRNFPSLFCFVQIEIFVNMYTLSCISC